MKIDFYKIEVKLKKFLWILYSINIALIVATLMVSGEAIIMLAVPILAAAAYPVCKGVDDALDMFLPATPLYLIVFIFSVAWSGFILYTSIFTN